MSGITGRSSTGGFSFTPAYPAVADALRSADRALDKVGHFGQSALVVFGGSVCLKDEEEEVRGRGENLEVVRE
jgi:hypothetical protein